MQTDSPNDRPHSVRRSKLAVARVLESIRWHAAARAAEKRFGLMRVFNTHSTPPRYAASFERQLDHLLERYEAVDPYRLEEAVAAGPSGRPLAVFTFDDGFRNHFDVAAVALEERGARGIFCVPVDFPSVPESEQADWCRQRIRRTPNAEHTHDEDLLAMSWDQIKDLIARGHRICSHTLSHEVLSATTPAERLAAEVVESRQRLEDELGVSVDGFCWPSDRDQAAAAARELVCSTYSYALIGQTRPLRRGHDPLDLSRTRFEPSWPLEAVDMQVSGVIDGIWAVRRARAAFAR